MAPRGHGVRAPSVGFLQELLGDVLLRLQATWRNSEAPEGVWLTGLSRPLRPLSADWNRSEVEVHRQAKTDMSKGFWNMSVYPRHDLSGTAIFADQLGWCQGGQCMHIFHTWSIRLQHDNAQQNDPQRPQPRRISAWFSADAPRIHIHWHTSISPLPTFSTP